MNDKKQLINAIEKMNIDYIKLQNSSEYNRGKHLNKIIYYLRHFRIDRLVADMFEYFKVKKLLKFQNISNTTEEYKKYYEISGDSTKKIVVYSCVTGNYDCIQEPFLVEKNVKYILYTDNKNILSDIWEIRDIPEKIKNINNNVLINRYIKMHPKELFDEFDYSIYIDGNVKLMSEISSLTDKIKNQSGLAFHKHKARQCAYDEISTCIKIGKGNKKELLCMKEKMLHNDFPRNYGLLECGVIVADLNNSNSLLILNNWWNDFCDFKCYRDQILLPYSLWKNDYKIDQIGIIGNNIYRNSKLRIIKHK